MTSTSTRYVWLVGALSVLVLDTAGALGARALGFAYVALVPVSYILYFCAGVGGGRLAGARAGLAAGAVTAFVDATIGWAAAAAIGPGRLSVPLNGPVIMLIIAKVTVTGAVLGLFGGGVGYRVRRLMYADV